MDEQAPVVPELGGWPLSYPNDPCSGGHPGPRALEDGAWLCNRCGRQLDLAACGCGAPGHEGVSRSYCPEQSWRDRAAVRRVAPLVDAEAVCPHDELLSDPCDECAFDAGDDQAARDWGVQ